MWSLTRWGDLDRKREVLTTAHPPNSSPWRRSTAPRGVGSMSSRWRGPRSGRVSRAPPAPLESSPLAHASREEVEGPELLIVVVAGQPVREILAPLLPLASST